MAIRMADRHPGWPSGGSLPIGNVRGNLRAHFVVFALVWVKLSTFQHQIKPKQPLQIFQNSEIPALTNLALISNKPAANEI